MTKIILQRHGQSIGNKEGIYLGHTDLGLTEEGRAQALMAAKSLENERIDAVYSSDLKRAIQTAMAHCEMRGLSLKTDSELREMHVGDWEGANTEDLKKLTEFTVERTHRDFCYPNGESVPCAAERMKNAIIKLAKENPDSTILIVSHSAAIRAFWYYLAGYEEINMTDRVPFMKNSSYCILTYDGELHQHEYGISDFLPSGTVYLA